MKKTPRKPELAVSGFMFSGIAAGIKKSGDYDLALIVSDRPAITAGVFTKNSVKAAPVRLAMERISSGRGQAIVINSGNANACTGKQGMRDAAKVKEKAAKALGLSPEVVYVSSTGVIGKRLPAEKIVKALPELVMKLRPSGLSDASQAIMTTDRYLKTASRQIQIGSRTGTIAAMAKGAGMICPDMATMLCFIMTDISLTRAALNHALKEAVARSFNMISVDNDMSTNDTVMAMANSSLRNKPLTRNSPDYKKFKDTLFNISYELARMIVKDGEGATKCVEITVNGARTESDARLTARSVAGSLLVKTAMYGKDPNWGRIMAAIGYSGAALAEEDINIIINKVTVVRNGLGTGKEELLHKALSDDDIFITIDLGRGNKSAKALTCDLTEEYININAHYGT